MDYWCGKFDMPHSFSSNFLACDFNTAAFADDALESDALVLAASTLPVFRGTEDLLAEKAIFFRL